MVGRSLISGRISTHVGCCTSTPSLNESVGLLYSTAFSVVDVAMVCNSHSFLDSMRPMAASSGAN